MNATTTKNGHLLAAGRGIELIPFLNALPGWTVAVTIAVISS